MLMLANPLTSSQFPQINSLTTAASLKMQTKIASENTTIRPPSKKCQKLPHFEVLKAFSMHIIP